MCEGSNPHHVLACTSTPAPVLSPAPHWACHAGGAPRAATSWHTVAQQEAKSLIPGRTQRGPSSLHTTHYLQHPSWEDNPSPCGAQQSPTWSRVCWGPRNIPAARITEDHTGCVCVRGRRRAWGGQREPVYSEGKGGCLRAAGSSPAALCTQGSSGPRKG